MRKKQQLLEKIDRAKKDIVAAEDELTRLLSELTQAPRAQKTTVSEVVENAFTRVRSAKVDLAELEDLIVSDED